MPSLEALIARADIEVLAVYTQPDRPAGRGRKSRQSAIKLRALAAGVEVRQPENFRSGSERKALTELHADLMVVAAYGQILPASVLALFKYPLNVHASLLPRWRGAAPIQRAIMAGDERTGISIMRVVEALDAGPVWCERTLPIEPHDTGGTLHDKLATLGGVALDEALDQLAANNIVETPQNEALVTYAAKISATDRTLEWSASAGVLERQIRALSPSPGARAKIAGIDVKLIAASAHSGTTAAEPGSVLGNTPTGLAIATGEGILHAMLIQPAGKQPMDAQAFANGYGKWF